MTHMQQGIQSGTSRLGIQYFEAEKQGFNVTPPTNPVWTGQAFRAYLPKALHAFLTIAPKAFLLLPPSTSQSPVLVVSHLGHCRRSTRVDTLTGAFTVAFVPRAPFVRRSDPNT
jgi:hypothetical protein